MEELADPKDFLILIADDDQKVRELLEVVVRREGFRVEVAMNGAQAMEKIRQLKPHLVLMDLMMPEFGGFEALRQLQVEEMQSIPILVITARYTERSTVEMISREPNVVGYIEKPIKIPVLGVTIHRILKTKPPDIKTAGSRSLGN